MIQSPVAGLLITLLSAAAFAAIARTPAPPDASCTWARMAHGSLAIERRDGSREVLAVRVADTPAEWAQGMQHLSPQRIRANPIWFAFPASARRGWHMRNVPIALDIAWTDPGGHVLDVGRMQPGRSGYGLAAPVRHALELAAGDAERLGIEPGTRLRLLATEPAATRSSVPGCGPIEAVGAAPTAIGPESAGPR